MTGNQALLLVHLLAASLWLGGGIGVAVFALRAEASGEPGRMLRTGYEVEWFGSRVLMPSAAMVLVSGVALTYSVASFREAWVLFSLAAFAVSVVSALVFLGPRPGALVALVAEYGPAAPIVEARIRRHFLYNRIEIVLLIAVLIDMVLKPGRIVT